MQVKTQWRGKTDEHDKSGVAIFDGKEIELKSFEDYFYLTQLIELEYELGLNAGIALVKQKVNSIPYNGGTL